MGEARIPRVEKLQEKQREEEGGWMSADFVLHKKEENPWRSPAQGCAGLMVESYICRIPVAHTGYYCPRTRERADAY